jgi:hypothetical protein
MSAGTFKGGDRILFKRGETFTISALTFRNINATFPENPVRLGVYGTGNKPIFQTTGAGHAMVTGDSTSYPPPDFVLFEDIEFDGNSTGLWSLRCVGGFGWRFRNCDLHDSNAGFVYGRAFVNNDKPAFGIFENCTLDTNNDNEGIYYGDASNSDDHSTVWVLHSLLSNIDKEAIDLKYGTAYAIIAYNQIIDSVSVADDFNAISCGGVRHKIIGNIIKNIGAAGSDDFNGINCEQYTISDNHLIEGNYVDTVLGSGSAGIKTGRGNNGVIVRGNTIISAGDYGIYVRNLVTGNVLKILNNILQGNGYGMRVGTSTSYILPAADYNLYYNNASNHLYLDGRGNAQTVATACANHSIECNAVTSNPVAGTNGEIDTDSPAYEAGDATGANRQRLGAAPSIGCWEPGYADNKVFARSDGLETGDLSRWDSNTGAVAAALAAALAGNYGLDVSISTTAAKYAAIDLAEPIDVFNVRLRLDTTDLSMTGGDEFTVIHLLTSADGDVAKLLLSYDGADYQVALVATCDSQAFSTKKHTISGVDNVIEIGVIAGQSGVNNGMAYLLIDGEVAEWFFYLDNDTKLVDKMRIGAQGLDAGTSGHLYLDDIFAGYAGIIGDNVTSQTPTGGAAATPAMMGYYRRLRI